jgi:hypothetical protein
MMDFDYALRARAGSCPRALPTELLLPVRLGDKISGGLMNETSKSNMVEKAVLLLRSSPELTRVVLTGVLHFGNNEMMECAGRVCYGADEKLINRSLHVVDSLVGRFRALGVRVTVFSEPEADVDLCRCASKARRFAQPQCMCMCQLRSQAWPSAQVRQCNTSHRTATARLAGTCTRRTSASSSRSLQELPRNLLQEAS